MSPTILRALPLLSFIVACSAPVVQTSNDRSAAPFIALRAPTPSPPASLSTPLRIRWWEDRIYRMDDADRREAYLRLGELYLENKNGMEARRCFRQALEGRLSTSEVAQAEYGIGRAYLLDSRPGLATTHLTAGIHGATGPGAEECRYLLAVCEGETLPATPELLQRVQPYLPDEGMVAAYAGSGMLGFLDVSRASWRAKPLRQNHEPMGPPTRITVHHSAEPLTSRKLSESRKEVLRIQSIHQDDKHWADIGYHFLIDPAGRIFEGRPVEIQGAHAVFL